MDIQPELPLSDPFDVPVVITGSIRLACRDCCREDFDGIYELPGDWRDIVQEQTFAEAIDDSDSNEYLFWWTHAGRCPDCIAAEKAENEA